MREFKREFTRYSHHFRTRAEDVMDPNRRGMALEARGGIHSHTKWKHWWLLSIDWITMIIITKMITIITLVKSPHCRGSVCALPTCWQQCLMSGIRCYLSFPRCLTWGQSRPHLPDLGLVPNPQSDSTVGWSQEIANLTWTTIFQGLHIWNMFA